ncbi:MAG TPA: hypothetical protein VHK45_09120 [Geminicoccaceae bacterium]|jgi:hypothetical protein|nr:hypothetical protein [Geminicoccaceae bacterium]
MPVIEAELAAHRKTKTIQAKEAGRRQAEEAPHRGNCGTLANAD